MRWLLLALAIVAEVVGTSALAKSDGFRRLWPSVVVAVAYGVAFYFLALALRTIPVGVAYAVWSGAGIVLVAMIGWVWLGQKLDPAALLGIWLILAGVLVLQLFSKTTSH
jgi:small multidrug resistance pump